MALDYNEVRDWKEFQNLVSQYFKQISYLTDEVESTPDECGIGADLGKDLLVKISIRDRIAKYESKWIVQCKFVTHTVGPSDLSDYNLPTLINAHNATGYLLIVRNDVTANLRELFRCLNENSKSGLGYKYCCWNGNDFEALILDHPDLIKQFFPKYYKKNLKP